MSQQKLINNISSPINLIGKPDIKFTDEFDAAVYAKAYDVYWDLISQCPCKEKGANFARPTCKNCHGRGYIVIKRIQTKALLQSMNFSTQYKNWSMELSGTASITSLSRDKFGYMDRITLLESDQERNQLVYPIFLPNDEIIALLDYPPTEITDMRVFDGDSNKLIQISEKEIQIGEEGELILSSLKDILKDRGDKNYTFDSRTGISVRYKYKTSYHIIDTTRDLIISPVDGPKKELIRKRFPYHYIGMKSHLIIGEGNYNNLGKNILNNSVKQSNKVSDFDFM